MEYRYAVNENYEDFSSGRVFKNMNGVPNFPVRLIKEIFERCVSYSNKKKDLIVYDCCCGGGYALSVLGFCYNHQITKVIGSDIDPAMLSVAAGNLELLSHDGLKRRIEEIQSMIDQFQKQSHEAALQSAKKLQNLLTKEMKTKLFCANVFELTPFEDSPDIIITDVPYGNLVTWHGNDHTVDLLLESLAKVCKQDTIVAICMDKKQKCSQTMYRRLEKQTIGKRKFEIFAMDRINKEELGKL